MATKFGWESTNFFIPLIEYFLWIIIMVLIFAIVRLIFIPVIKKITTITSNEWDDVFFENKVFHAIIRFIPLSIGFNIIEIIFPFNVGLQNFAERTIGIILIITFIQLCHRITNSILELSKDNESYTTVGIRAFAQLTNMFFIFVGILGGVAIFFDVSLTSIVTVMGALTAAVVLIFRDYILGFLAGLQIASSKSVKVGDWITVEKGNINGIIREININIVKIENFDKTITTIPTADLITGKVVNHYPMLQSGTRKLKRAIIIQINSIKFVTNKEIKDLEKIVLLKPYLIDFMSKTPEDKTEDKDWLINHNRPTNLSIFITYIKKYLEIHSAISSKDLILVKQLEPDFNGMPVEIDCFLSVTDNLLFEKIQGEIIDHMIGALPYFQLKVAEVSNLNKKNNTND